MRIKLLIQSNLSCAQYSPILCTIVDVSISYCTKTRSTSESDLINKNFLPIWTDNNGNVRYDLPSELQDLSLTERLLIQKIAVLIPVVHMYQGQLGLNGHSVIVQERSISALH